MLITLLPVVAFSLALPPAHDPIDDVVITSPRTAQVRLADLLGGADAIESVRGNGHEITFAIASDGRAYHVVATTNRRGDVTGITMQERLRGDELGNLSWLVDAMQATTAVTQLAVDEDGAVTLTTNDGDRYMAIPGRGSGGNAAVEARFAADFDR